MSNVLTLIFSLSLSGTILAALIFAMKPFIRHRLSKTVQYAAWIIVLLRLILPFSFESSIINRLFYGNSTAPYSASADAAAISAESRANTMDGRVSDSEKGKDAYNGGDSSGQYASGDSSGIISDSELANSNTMKNTEQSNPGNRANAIIKGGAAANNSNLTSSSLSKSSSTSGFSLGSSPKINSKFALLFNKAVPYIFSVWLLGVVLIFAANLKGYVRFLREIKKTNRAAGSEERELLGTLLQSHRLSVRRSVSIVRNPYVAAPMTIGVGRPCIILPDRAFNTKQIQNILLHELAHVKWFDVAVKWFTMLVSSVHWFNPFLIWIRKEINHACELACDETVVRNFTNQEKQDYGDTLISVVSAGRYPLGVLQATMSEDKKTLKDRLKAIMMHGKKPKVILILSGVLLLSIVFGALALGAGVGIGTAKPPKIYIFPEWNGHKEAITGSYQWKNGVSYTFADADHPVYLEYKSENTVSVTAGEQLIMSPQLRKIDKKYDFTAAQVQVYKNEEPYSFQMDDPVYTMDSLYLQAPKEKGEYIYSLKLDFGKRGTVYYGFMVYVDTPFYDIDDIAKHKTPYVGDNSKVSAIVSRLPVPDNSIIQRYISLDTVEKPYGLTVFYEPISNGGNGQVWPLPQGTVIEEILRKNALVLFCMIDNLDSVTIAFRNTPSDGKLDSSAYDEVFQFQRTSLEEEYGNLFMLKNRPGLLQDKLKDKITEMKGLELYIWKKSELLKDNDILYTLLPGTNRNKTDKEVFDLSVAATSFDTIKKMLSKYSNDNNITVLFNSDIDVQIVTDTKKSLLKIFRNGTVSTIKVDFDELLQKTELSITQNGFLPNIVSSVKSPYKNLYAHASTMEELLGNSRFTDMPAEKMDAVMARLPDLIRKNYSGIGRLEQTEDESTGSYNGYVILACKPDGTALPDGTTMYSLSPGGTMKEQVVLEDKEGKEICRFPLGLNVRYYSKEDLFLILAEGDQLTGKSNGIKQIEQLAGFQFAGDTWYMEYEREAKLRGSTILWPQPYPYISADIYLDGRSWTEYVPVEAVQAQDIKDKLASLNNISFDPSKIKHSGISICLGEEEQYMLCFLEDGTTALMDRNNFRKAFAGSQMVEDLLNVAESKTLWEWVEQSEIHDLVRAEMRMKLGQDSDTEIQVVDDEKSLKELEDLFTNAEYTGISGCPFTAQLLLTRSDGRVITLHIATDSCDSMILGTSAGYDYGPRSKNNQQALIRIFNEVNWIR